MTMMREWGWSTRIKDGDSAPVVINGGGGLRLDAAPATAKEAGEGGIVLEGVLIGVEVLLDAELELVLGALVAEAEGDGDFLEL